MNTDYGMRRPGTKEVRDAFGGALKWWQATGGRLSLTLFYLNNQDRIPGAPRVKIREFSEWSEDLRDLVAAERLAIAEAERQTRQQRKDSRRNEILALHAEGKNRSQIARGLKISWHTVNAAIGHS